jgi:hypothetical protein
MEIVLGAGFTDRRSLNPAPGAAGELHRGGRRALHERGNIVEGHGEQIMQHEGESLVGSKRLERHEQR